MTEQLADWLDKFEGAFDAAYLRLPAVTGTATVYAHRARTPRARMPYRLSVPAAPDNQQEWLQRYLLDSVVRQGTISALAVPYALPLMAAFEPAPPAWYVRLTGAVSAQAAPTWSPFVESSRQRAAQIYAAFRTDGADTVAIDPRFLDLDHYAARLYEAGLHPEELASLAPLMTDEVLAVYHQYNQVVAVPPPQTAMLARWWAHVQRLAQQIIAWFRGLAERLRGRRGPVSGLFDIRISSAQGTYRSRIGLDADTLCIVDRAPDAGHDRAELSAFWTALDEQMAIRKRWLEALVVVARMIRLALSSVVALPLTLAAMALSLLMRGLATLREVVVTHGELHVRKLVLHIADQFLDGLPV